MDTLLMLCSGSQILCQCVKKVSPTFYSIRFNVTRFMLRSFIHFDLSFLQVIDMDLLESDMLWHPVKPAPFFEDSFFSLLYTFDFVKNQVSVSVEMYFCIFFFWFHSFLSVFIPIL